MTVRVWDPEAGVPVAALHGHTGGVNGCAISPDGKFAATISDETTIRIWLLPDVTEAEVLHGHADWVKACSISRASTWVACACTSPNWIWSSSPSA